MFNNSFVLCFSNGLAKYETSTFTKVSSLHTSQKVNAIVAHKDLLLVGLDQGYVLLLKKSCLEVINKVKLTGTVNQIKKLSSGNEFAIATESGL